MKKLLVFTAKWCGPCKNMKRVLDTFVENPSTPPVDIVYFDLDDNPAEFDNYGVAAVPTLVLLDQDGTELKRNAGLITNLKDFLS